jgi:hypothetical protein
VSLRPGHEFIFEHDLEVQQYIDDATKLVIHTADQGGTLHLSQSFSGSPRHSAILASLVACPETHVLKVQDAINRAAEEVLHEFRVFEPTVH